MIGFAEVGVEHLLGAGFLASGSRLGSDKYGMDLTHQLGIIDLQNPAPRRLGIRVEKAQTALRTAGGVRHRPDLETPFCV